MGNAPENPRVLIVNEDPRVRADLARALRANGFVPVVSASAEEAFAFAQDDQFISVVVSMNESSISNLPLLQRLDPIQPRACFVILKNSAPVDPDLLPKDRPVHLLEATACLEELIGLLKAPGSAAPLGQASNLGAPRLRNRVLLVEDDDADAYLFEAALCMACPDEFAITRVSSLGQAYQTMENRSFDVIVLDLGLPDAVGLATVAKIQAAAPNVGLVVLSGCDDPDLALQAVQVGAQDYLVKGRTGGASVGKAIRYAEQRKRSELRLANMAFHDQLTGLANRALFRQRVAQASAQARRSGGHFAVLLVDLDRFKDVNDDLGHDAGDAFLREIAQRLQHGSRETDTVARLGGDEFAVLAQPIAAAADVRSIAERILFELNRPLELSGAELNPAASIGVAAYPHSGEDSDTLLAAADTAMYVAKSRGRNAFHVHGVELLAEVARKTELEARLRRATEALDFALFYQPQVNTEGRVVGAEALLRWTPQNQAVIEAARFIQVLEDAGLILDLGPWIAQTACEQLRKWRDDGHVVPRISINISARQLANPALVEQLAGAVADAGLNACDIELELNEKIMQRGTEKVGAMIVELSRMGFRIALDAFGTGDSPLTYLGSLPISTVKLDRSLIGDVVANPRRRGLVGGIIQFSRRLGLDVVAEGVETKQQASVLREEGCLLLQGQLYGSAVSGAEFTEATQDAPQLDDHTLV